MYSRNTCISIAASPLKHEVKAEQVTTNSLGSPEEFFQGFLSSNPSFSISFLSTPVLPLVPT